MVKVESRMHQQLNGIQDYMKGVEVKKHVPCSRSIMQAMSTEVCRLLVYQHCIGVSLQAIIT